jgi:hypothetical protein
MKLFVILMVCLVSDAFAVNFVDIIMEEWEDWKLSHSIKSFYCFARI